MLIFSYLLTAEHQSRVDLDTLINDTFDSYVPPFGTASGNSMWGVRSLCTLKDIGDNEANRSPLGN